MKGYLALTQINLKLAMREKVVLFFNFLFPLLFFFVFGQMMDASLGGVGVRVVSMVLVLGVLGNGLFGAGVRSVVERETNVLRRYKVTPISPAPILVASLVTGWLLYLPVILMILVLAHLLWGVPWPAEWISLFALLSVGAWAMRAIGLIVASVVNSAAESNIMIQLLYMPMLFLSGATFPISMLPEWAQILAQFLPASYLHSGMERVMIRNESLADNPTPVLALLFCTAVATLISMKIFRWEKEEVLPARAKLWLLVVGLPFVILGAYQAHSRENIQESAALDREIRRNRTRLIRDARIFIGDGQVIESGALLIKDGKIHAVYEGVAPDPESLNAEVVEAAGKTVLPGLIDAHVHLVSPGGVLPDSAGIDFQGAMKRGLAAYLYSGVTAVRSSGDPAAVSLRLREEGNRGVYTGAELFACGPVFTAEDGYGAGYISNIPDKMKALTAVDLLRTPGSPEEARAMVRDLSQQGVNGIDAVLDGGLPERPYAKLAPAIFTAIAAEAGEQNLPLTVRAGGPEDVARAVDAGAAGVRSGSRQQEIAPGLLDRLKQSGAAYNPALVSLEAGRQLAEGRTDLLRRSLVEQVAIPGMIAATASAVQAAGSTPPPPDSGVAAHTLRQASEQGVLLVTGTGSGNPLLLHGAGIHREMQLWVGAGLPPAVVLQAATYNAARALRASDRMGLIRPGYEASLLLVDGNPLQDISDTERISVVFFKGERINRPGLLERD